MGYRVVFTEDAEKLLAAVRDKRELKLLIDRIGKLAENPEQQGKPLSGDLVGYRSIRAVGQRYRIIYWVEEEAVMVVVALLGRRKDGDRKDVYRLAKKVIPKLQLNRILDESTEEE